MLGFGSNVLVPLSDTLPTCAASAVRAEVRCRSSRSLPTGTRRSKCWG